MSRKLCPLVIPFVLTALSGCTDTRKLWIAPYVRGAQPTMRPVPETGVYKVKWSLLRNDRSFGLEETRRIVRAGDPLGFRTDEEGRVFALAGNHEMPLDNLHPRARFCVWSCTLEEPTDVAVSMASVGDAVLKAPAFVAVGIAELTLYSFNEDDDASRIKYGNAGNDDDDDADDKPLPTRPPTDRGERYERRHGRVQVTGN